MDDEGRTLRHTPQYTVVEAHLAYLLVGEHADDDEFGVGADSGDVADRGRAGLLHGRPGVVVPGEHVHVVSVAHQPLDHRQPHTSGADEVHATHRG